MPRGLAGSLFALLLTASPAAAQVTWTFRGPVVPIARIEDAMVYDSVQKRMVMFGGYDLNFHATNDIWEYDGAARVWTNVTAPGPSIRHGAAMAYDPLRGRILMFGGIDAATVAFGETWIWDTVAKSWTQLNLSPAPAARGGAGLVYDADNDRFVLHGGWDPASGLFADTWQFDPATDTWSNLNPGAGPTFYPRAYHGFVHNSTNGRPTVFGGTGGPSGFLNDLWELQGNTWVEITPAGVSPPPRAWSGVAYESGNARLVLYGGWSGSFSYSDTWAWNGSAWSQLPNGPTARDSHAMVWDPDRARSVVFGGFSADVRELVGSTWTGPFNDVRWPPADDEHAVAYDPLPVTGHRRIFLYGGGSPHVWETFHYGNNNGTLTWRFPWLFPPGSGGPGGRIGHAMVWEGPQGRAVLFGGRERNEWITGPTVFGDTWSFRRTPGVVDPTWTPLGGGPPARYDHAMVYDPAQGRIVMFGGRNAAGAPLGDTWLWNGGSWSPGPSGPPARFNHAMAYDPARAVVVLFGGEDAGGKLGDTWEWNGSVWALRATTGPSPRSGPALSDFGSPCGGVLLFGGRNGAGSVLDDHWLWSGTGWTSAGLPSPRPSAREHARMLYDPAEARLWLFGGRTAAGRSGEMWTGTVGGASGSFSVNDVAVGEDGGAATFTVSLAPPQPSGASVSYATANGTALAGSDYAPASGTVFLSACQGSAPVAIAVLDDLVDEPDETFVVNLSAASGGTIVDGQGQATIADDDAMPEVVVEDCAVMEGDAGSTPCPFQIRLSNPSAGVVTVSYATANGTASAGSDYTAAAGTLTFPALTTGPQAVSVPVLGDAAVEGDEFFVLNLSGAGGATLPDPQGVGTVLDDDAPSLSGLELTHGSVLTADLAADPGPVADVDAYRLAQAPRSSYEVLLDAVSGDVAPQVLLERLASDNFTVLQAAPAVGTGTARSLRFENVLAAAVTGQHIRVRGAGCGAACGPDDVYRLRVYETTYSIPRFNNAGGTQVSIVLIQNPTGYTTTGHAWFWDTAGALLHVQPFTLPPKGLFTLNTASVAALAGKGGTVTISNDGRYGDLTGKAIALEPSTGFSFDSPMTPRPRPYY